MATKLDLKKQWRHLYAPSASKVEVVEVPAFQFIVIDGQIESGAAPDSSPAFHQALEALYGASFTLKFTSKLRKDNPIDYTVMALEGLWWSQAGAFDFERKDQWQWRLMMMQPEHITGEMFGEAVRRVMQKKENPAIADLRLERFHEGLCMQCMHVGPYSDEPRTITRMMAFAQENGYRVRGKHHEIYLGDPRRASPEKVKTILRHPIETNA
jgi:hypothetical protein